MVVMQGDFLINRTNSKELVGKSAIFRSQMEIILMLLILLDIDLIQALCSQSM